MPAKNKTSREGIIAAAFEIVRQGGWAQLSARSIAKALKTSTMPIYSQFATMELIEEEVVKKAISLMAGYEAAPRTDVIALNHGIGYVLFAWEEPHLFAAINDEKHVAMQTRFGDTLFDAHVAELANNTKMAGLSQEQLRYFQFMAWIFVHGIASMKHWMEQSQGQYDKEKLIELLRDGSKMLTNGFVQNQARSLKKSKKGNL
jgi:AcrR family transcriptional regulator